MDNIYGILLPFVSFYFTTMNTKNNNLPGAVLAPPRLLLSAIAITPTPPAATGALAFHCI